MVAGRRRRPGPHYYVGPVADSRTPCCQQWTDTGCFHVINRGHNRETIFADDADKRFFFDLIARYQRRCPQLSPFTKDFRPDAGAGRAERQTAIAAWKAWWSDQKK
jgi:hypothetical protein